MGRQINFFMEKEKEEEFVKFAFEKNFYVIEKDLKKKKIFIFKNFEEYSLFSKSIKVFLCKDTYRNFSEKYDEFNSNFYSDNTIEFFKTCYFFNDNSDKIISAGRIWFEYKYFDDDGNLITKNDQLIKDYNMLARWIKKNAPLQEHVVSINGEEHTFKDYMTEKMLELSKTGNYRFS